MSTSKILSTVIAKKNIYNGVSAPTATDDSAAGYSVGSTWVDVSANKSYICVDSTATAAVWNQIDGATAGGSTTLSAFQAGLTSIKNNAGISHYVLDKTVFAVGVDLTLDGTGAIVGLKAGKTYRLDMVIKGDSPATGFGNYAIKNVTTNTVISEQAQTISVNNNVPNGSNPSQTAIYTPTANCNVGISNVGGTVGELGIGTTLTVLEIPTATVTNTSVANNLAAIVAPTVTDDSAAGYTVGSTWIDVVADKTYICVDSTSTSAIWHQIDGAGGLQDNLTAIIAPTATDDASTGYSVGSTWIDVTANQSYLCVDSTATTAIWNQIGGAIASTPQLLHYAGLSYLASSANTGFPYSAIFDTINAESFGATTDLVTNSITVSRSGKYSVSMGATFRSLSSAKTTTMQIGGVNSSIRAFTTAGANSPNAANTTGVISLSAGDVLTVVITSATTESDVNVAGTYLSITEVPTQNITIANITNNLVATIAPTATDDSSLGYSVGSTWIDVTANKTYVCVDSTTITAIWNQIDGIAGLQDNLAATIAPTATDDSSIGYVVGSTWIDVTADKTYVCVDSTPTTAIWNQIDGGAAADAVVEADIVQTTHGLTLLDSVRFDGTNWVKALADSAGIQTAQGIVSKVVDVNTFDVTSFGSIIAIAHGLTVANYYWLDQTTSGASTVVQPSSGTSQSLFYVRDANTVFVSIEQPTTVSAAGIQNNYAGVVAPSTGADSSVGYSVGSVWIDTVGNAAYICISAAVGAAVWKVMA